LELLYKRLNLSHSHKALQLTAGVQVNIYTNSKYVFTTTHVHGALYKERGLINLGGKNIKYGQKNPQTDVLNRWQLYTAEGTQRETQQLLRETGKLIGKSNKQPSRGDQPQLP
jgi:hypothetical protein